MVDRSPREDITSEQRQQAVASILAGKESARGVARRLGVHHRTVTQWYHAFLDTGAEEPEPEHFPIYGVPAVGNLANDDGRDRSNERLARYVYDAVIAQLEAITARARITGSTSFIERQSADHLAQIDDVAWTQVIRLVNFMAYRAGSNEPEYRLPEYRNGAVGTPD